MVQELHLVFVYVTPLLHIVFSILLCWVLVADINILMLSVSTAAHNKRKETADIVKVGFVLSVDKDVRMQRTFVMRAI